MKTILYHYDGTVNPSYYIYRESQTDKVDEFYRTMQNSDSMHTSGDGYGESFKVPEYSYLRFYIGEKLVGTVPIDNEDLLDHYGNHSNRHSIEYIEKLFRAKMDMWYEDFFKPYAVNMVGYISTKAFLVQVEDDYYVCSAELVDTIQMLPEGYMAYAQDNSAETSMYYGRKINVSPYLVLTVPNGLGMCTYMTCYEGHSRPMIDTGFYYSSLTKIIDTYHSQPFEYIGFNIGMLSNHFVITKQGLLRQSQVEGFTDTTSNIPAWKDAVVNGSDDLIRRIIDDKLPSICEKYELAIEDGKFVGTGKHFGFGKAYYDVTFMDWTDFYYKRICDVEYLNGQLSYNIERADYIDDDMYKVYENLYFGTDAVPIRYFGDVIKYYKEFAWALGNELDNSPYVI